MSKRKTHDVIYYDLKGKKIAGSTRAVSDTLALFKPMARSWEHLKSLLPYGFEEKQIIDEYIKRNIDFNKVIFQ